jgi:hypothetical protein
VGRIGGFRCEEARQRDLLIDVRCTRVLSVVTPNLDPPPYMGTSMSRTKTWPQAHLSCFLCSTELNFLESRQRSSFCSAPAEPILPFSNRGHKCKRFLSCFLVLSLSFSLRRCRLSSAPTRIGRTSSHPGRTLTVRNAPANWMIAGAGDQRGLRV